MLSMRKYTGKHILAYVRGCNYAHPGEEEAVLAAMSAFKKDSGQKILDVGCGLGGTTYLMQKNGWGKVTGFDIEIASIEYAKKSYPEVDFYVSNVNDISHIFQNEFDILCLFSSFYAFHDQKSALSALNNTAKKNGSLMIFEYLDLCKNSINPLFRGSDYENPFIPIRLDTLQDMLDQTGWETQKIIDISDKFQIWYEQLVTKIVTKKDELTKLFTEYAYQKTYDTYSQLLNAIYDKKLGGVMAYARKIY